MVIPTTYSDIGKAAKDLLSKGFNHGEIRVEWKNKLKHDAELNFTGVHVNESAKMTGSTEMKSSRDGFNLLAKWSTDNRFTAESSCQDKLVNGLKLKAEGSFEPHTGDKSGKVEVEYKRDCVRALADAKFLALHPVLHSGLTVAFRHVTLGGDVTYDSANMQLKGYGLATSYESNGVILSAIISDMKNVTTSVYHRVSSRLETAAAIDWTVGQPQSRISFGNKFALANGATLKGVINSLGIVGLAYSQAISDGVKATISSEFDSKTFGSAGKHRFGLTFEFDSSAMRF